jgi:hypothetical protein
LNFEVAVFAGGAPFANPVEDRRPFDLVAISEQDARASRKNLLERGFGTY